MVHGQIIHTAIELKWFVLVNFFVHVAPGSPIFDTQLGGLGSVLLELLAREEWLGRIVAADRDAERGIARANCVEADGKLVILDEDGMLYLASATPEKLVVRSSTQLLEGVA